VFVDDAVRGTLPGVCVKDGVPTSDLMTVRDELGDRAGLGVAWLLLLLGPLGWLGLLLVSISRSGRGEVLAVQLPLAEPAYERLRAARRLRRLATGGGVIGFVLGLGSIASYDPASPSAFQWQLLGLVAAAVVAGGVIGALLAEHRIGSGSVRVDLDASRRWVTLSGVHPAFAAACQAQLQQHPPPRT